MIRVGQGFDLHRVSDDPSRRLLLGGVHFEGAPGLVGHSDADVVAHALCDALLGATGLGDLGTHFPDTDPRYAGADSMTLLAEVVSLVHAEGWTIANGDVTVLAEVPKIGPRRAEIEANLERVVRAPISVKATTMERLGPIGEGLALAASAVVLLEGAHP